MALCNFVYMILTQDFIPVGVIPVQYILVAVADQDFRSGAKNCTIIM